jgi:hypothetical protein
MSFEMYHFRNMAQELMRKAINTASEVVKEVKSIADQQEWQAVYSATIAAEPNEKVRELCHQLKRRAPVRL